MHPALQLEDILDLIFVHLTQNQATLASLAQTCRAFTRPALRILWRDCHDLSQFSALLPPWARARLKSTFQLPAVGFWHLANRYCSSLPPAPPTWALNYDNHLTSVESTSPPEAADPKEWERFHTYARLVRSLTLEGDQLPRTQLQIMRFLAHCGRVPVLPLLRCLCLQAVNTDGLAALYTFLGPELEVLELHRPKDMEQEALDAFLEELVLRSPRLRSLKAAALSDPEGQESLLRTVLALSHLQNLELGATPVPEFYHRVAGSSVRALTIDLSGPQAKSVDSQPIKQAALPNLESLTLTATCVSSPQGVFSTILFPSLSHLSLDITQTLTPPPAFTSLLALLSSTFGATLQKFDLALSPLNLSLHPASAFLPLANLRKMEYFALALSKKASAVPLQKLSLDEETILALVKAWPRLQVFSLPIIPRGSCGIVGTSPV